MVCLIPSRSSRFGNARHFGHLLIGLCESGQKQETDRFEKCSSAVFDKLMMFNLDNITAKVFHSSVALDFHLEPDPSPAAIPNRGDQD